MQRRRPQTGVLRGARRLQPDAALRRPDVAAPLRVPAPRLRRLHDLQRVLQGAAARHPRAAHRADGRRHRRAPLQAGRRAPPPGEAGDRHRGRRRVRRGPHAGGDRRRARRERRRPRVARGARADQGPVVQHGRRRRPLPLLRQLVRRPEHPVRLGGRPHPRAEGGRGGRAADRGDRARARPARRGVRRAARRPRRARRSTSCSASRARSSRTSRSTSSTATTGSSRAGGTSCASSARCSRGTASSRTARTCSSSAATRSPRRSTSCCSPGRPAARRSARSHWPPIVARRKELLAQARRVDAAAGDRRHARGDHRPDVDHALGRHHPARAGVGERGGGRRRADRRGRVAGHGRGPGAGRDRRRRASPRCATATILVCPITSPAWAPIFPKVEAVVTDIGGVMSHAAIVCREYGLPAVVGTGRATARDHARAS